jgi:YihY family inner membrane protein
MPRDPATGAALSEVANSAPSDAPEAAVSELVADLVTTPEPVVPVTETKWYLLRRNGTALLQYLLDSEVHTFAFSVAANAILSFIPFVVLLYALATSVFRSTMMVSVIGDMVKYYFPSNQTFIIVTLDNVARHTGAQAFSIVMILVACTGIFLPLEVALNQAWGVTKSRNYLFNQAIALGLALLMVVLGIGSIIINAVARDTLALLFLQHTDNFVFHGIESLLLILTTGVASILFFFSIYWILPNRKVPWRPVFRAAVVTGIIWLIAK